MDTKSLVKLAKSLSDPTRLRMLQEIARAQRMGCANLYEFVPISQPSMSQHVKALVEAGLVDSCKEGRNMYLTINAEKLQELESFLHTLRGLHVVGLDVMEVLPDVDTADVTAVAAAKLVREAALLFG